MLLDLSKSANTLKWLFLTILWMIYWLAIAGATIYILPTYLNADQFHNSWITIIYYTLFIFISAVLFKVKDFLPHMHRGFWQIRVIFAMAAIFVLITYLYDSVSTLDPIARTAILESKLYYPLFSIQTTIPKSFDITFQQITIFGFIKYLHSKSYDKRQILFIVGLAFGSVHLPLMLGPGIYWVVLVLPGLFAGFLFSNFILNHRFGLIYSFAFHFAFYFISGVVLRTYRG